MVLNLRNGKDVGGRPPKADDEKRIYRIPLQLTYDEREDIKQKANSMNMNMSQFIRYLVKEAFKELRL